MLKFSKNSHFNKENNKNDEQYRSYATVSPEIIHTCLSYCCFLRIKIVNRGKQLVTPRWHH